MLTSAALRSAATSAATQRAALPQAPTSPPSAFQMRMNTSALRDGSSAMSWSQPIPSLRSAMARTASGAERKRARPRVEHDEIVAEPVHLAEGYRGSLHLEPYRFAAPI